MCQKIETLSDVSSTRYLISFVYGVPSQSATLTNWISINLDCFSHEKSLLLAASSSADLVSGPVIGIIFAPSLCVTSQTFLCCCSLPEHWVYVAANNKKTRREQNYEMSSISADVCAKVCRNLYLYTARRQHTQKIESFLRRDLSAPATRISSLIWSTETIIHGEKISKIQRVSVLFFVCFLLMPYRILPKSSTQTITPTTTTLNAIHARSCE